MNKNIIIAVIVILAAIAAYFIWGSGGGMDLSTVQNPSTLRELLTGGENLTCTFSYSQEGADMDGTVYVSGGKMRGDYSMMQGGESFDSHMISDSELAYMWGSNSQTGTYGFKVPITDMEAEKGDSQYQAVDWDQTMDIQCSRWMPDASKFNPPTDVNFQDLGAITQQMLPQAGQPTGDLSNLCATCDMAPDEASRVECRASLGCE